MAAASSLAGADAGAAARASRRRCWRRAFGGSTSQARRDIAQGAVKLDGEPAVRRHARPSSRIGRRAGAAARQAPVRPRPDRVEPRSAGGLLERAAPPRACHGGAPEPTFVVGAPKSGLPRRWGRTSMFERRTGAPSRIRAPHEHVRAPHRARDRGRSRRECR